VSGKEEFLASNRSLWDEWTAVHEGSEFYDLEGGRLRARDGVSLRKYSATRPVPARQPSRTAVPEAVTMSIEPPCPTVS
jgi:hypothetical protein